MGHRSLLKSSNAKKTLFKLALLILSVFLLVSTCKDDKLISYDFETYFSGSTSLENKFSKIMPSKKDLIDSKIVYYVYYYNDEDAFTFAEGMIRLTVEYPNEKFINESQRLEELYEANNSVMDGQFYYEGVSYKSFMFYDDAYGYGALAYHICSNQSTISYIAFECNNLTYMDVESALNLFPHTANEYRQTQVNGSLV